MRISRRVLFFSTLSAMALVAGPVVAEPFKLKIACTATSDCASAMVARDEGIFAKHGIDADVQLIAINTNIPPAIVSDSIQIGGPTATVFLQAVDGGLDLVAVDGRLGDGPGRRQERSRPSRARAFRSRSAKDFVGKKVGAPGIGAFLHVLFRKWLIDNGVDPTKRQLRRSNFPDDERHAEVGSSRRRPDRGAVHHADQERRQRGGHRRITSPTSAAPIRSSPMSRRVPSPSSIPTPSRRSGSRSPRPRRSSTATVKRRARRSPNSPGCRSISSGSTSPPGPSQS